MYYMNIIVLFFVVLLKHLCMIYIFDIAHVLRQSFWNRKSFLMKKLHSISLIYFIFTAEFYEMGGGGGWQ